MTCPT